MAPEKATPKKLPRKSYPEKATPKKLPKQAADKAVYI
jgi:hypothetical protein